MAFQASTSALRRIRPRITQWESVTGRRIPPSLLRQWLEAELSVEAGRAERSRALDIQQQGVDLQEERLGLLGEQLEAERGAAKVSGVAELATGGLLLGKEFGVFKGAQGLLGLGGAKAGVGAGKAVTAGVGTFPWAGGILPGGTTAAGAGAVAPTATTTATTAGAGGVGGAGLLSTALPVAATIAGTYLGRKLGEQEWFQNITPWGGEKTERFMGGGIAGGFGTSFLFDILGGGK